MADMEKATAVGELIARFVEKQTALEQHFLLHMHGDTGELVTELPDDLALFYRLDRWKPQRLFFMLGYLVFFFLFSFFITCCRCVANMVDLFSLAHIPEFPWEECA